MTGNEYQKLAMKTNDGCGTMRLQKAVESSGIDVGGIVTASLGLSGETGELNDMIKKAIFHGHALDSNAVKNRI